MDEGRIKVGFFRTLEYKENYNTFTDFYTVAKPEIYKTIIDLFEEMKNSNKEILTISLSAKIAGFDWDTHFSFMKDQYFIMKRDFLPYFEENEDYEMCKRIMTLDKELVS